MLITGLLKFAPLLTSVVPVVKEILEGDVVRHSFEEERKAGFYFSLCRATNAQTRRSTGAGRRYRPAAAASLEFER